MNRFILLSIFKNSSYFDGEGGATSPPPPPPPPAGKTFTQDEVNKMMAEHKRTLQTQNSELVKQLEELRSNVNLTAQQRDELDSRIQALQQQHLTKEQQLQAELEKTTKKYKTELETTSAEAKRWLTNYNNVLVENAVTQGAVKHNAASAKQILAIIGPQVKVVEEVDDKGQGTGKFVPKITVTTVDAKTKKPVQIEVDVVEGIGKMREDPEFANLFLVDGKPGLGGSNVGPSGSEAAPNIANMTPAQYRAWREKAMKS